MKAVLISIQPKWCELIASGKKTIEVRKTRPKIETPFKCYIYQTKERKEVGFHFEETGETFRESFVYGMKKARIVRDYAIIGGKVIGEFVCGGIMRPNNSLSRMAKESLLTEKELFEYSNGKKLYGWHISDLKIYDKPKELGEFWAYNAELHKRFANEEDFCCYNGTNEYGELLNECALYNTDIKRCYSCWEEWSGWCHRIIRPPQSWCYVEQLE